MREMQIFRLIAMIFLAGCAALALASTQPTAAPTQSKDMVRNAPTPVAFQVQTLVKGLSHPWSLAWLPGGDMLVTEREGRLRRVSREFQLDPRPIEGLPADIVVDGQGGLFDVAVHPDHARNGWVYLAYAQAAKDMVQSGRCGFYLAVEQTGRLQAGAPFQIIPGSRSVSVGQALQHKAWKHLR
jgi:glucose/arabinose dehydrogenase